MHYGDMKLTSQVPVRMEFRSMRTRLIEGLRTRVGQPKMKYWKLHELHKNAVKKNVHPICPKIWKSNFEQLLKLYFQVWGGKYNSVGLDHSFN